MKIRNLKEKKKIIILLETNNADLELLVGSAFVAKTFIRYRIMNIRKLIQIQGKKRKIIKEQLEKKQKQSEKEQKLKKRTLT